MRKAIVMSFIILFTSSTPMYGGGYKESLERFVEIFSKDTDPTIQDYESIDLMGYEERELIYELYKCSGMKISRLQCYKKLRGDGLNEYSNVSLYLNEIKNKIGKINSFKLEYANINVKVYTTINNHEVVFSSVTSEPNAGIDMFYVDEIDGVKVLPPEIPDGYLDGN